MAFPDRTMAASGCGLDMFPHFGQTVSSNMIQFFGFRHRGSTTLVILERSKMLSQSLEASMNCFYQLMMRGIEVRPFNLTYKNETRYEFVTDCLRINQHQHRYDA